jgi:glycosyltransferase involved in cell wall biosynthesis
VPLVAHVVKTQAVAGAENHLLKLLPGIAGRGWDVHLLNVCDRSQGAMTPAYGAALERLEASGVRVSRLGVGGKADPRGSLHLARALKAIGPDLVHTHLAYADLFGSIGARLARVPRVLSSRHHDYSTSPSETRRFRRYYRVVNPLQDRVIAISGRIAQLCRDEEHRDPGSIDTVWYGCEDQAVDRAEAREALRRELGLASDALLVGTIGRLIALKGQEFALRAFAGIAPRVPRATWLFAGSGPERDALERLAKSSGLGERVRFLGHREDVPRIMAALDVLVHPTTAEGFGLVLLEGMVQATPIVATRVGSLPEIVIDGETGLLVPPRDPTALGAALLALLEDRARLAAVGRAGRERYERCFRLERMIGETIDIYRRVLGDA